MKVFVHVGSWHWWIHEWFWELSQKDGRAREKSISCPEFLGSGALLVTLRWNWYGCKHGRIQRVLLHGTNRSKTGYASLPKLPLPPTAVFASVHALAKLNLLREPLSAAAHTACEHVRTLESSGVFNCSRAGPARDGHKPYVGRGLSTPPGERRWPPESVKNSWSEEGAENQKMGLRTAPTRHAGPATIPSRLLRVGSVRRLGPPCL